MIKRILYFGNPAYLSLSNLRLVVRCPGEEVAVKYADEDKLVKTIPIEDIGVVIIDHKQVTMTSGIIASLLANNVAIVTCDEKSMPTGLMLPLDSHSLQEERFEAQIEMSLPLKKQLWKQTVEQKIRNQAALLARYGEEIGNMMSWSMRVKSGDSDNVEARAAAYYWRNMFPNIAGFTRERFGEYPNPLLNYGYAILRAIMARSLVAAGLLPVYGIHHHNRYNAYCLADDLMEPYRPYVDLLVTEMVNDNIQSLTKDAKARLMSLATIDVEIDGHRSPLMIASQLTANSLRRCFLGESRKILFPIL